ncbi:succinate dehydrogenase assembly factor 4, mitochondrial [Drosophila grimshawi]|uniref:Succinate dehydrogenase assembly factor 4, mitochondrial n=1 Tax=Drosophila grimshawi TaxID=7222 RepID=B4JPG1_DROGR|nr:succinate dehydrogenase assembly factor 4, mitochondrial [Drosophila grimshawi]EDV98791.1 GH13408 [Drosophila grimshawi]
MIRLLGNHKWCSIASIRFYGDSVDAKIQEEELIKEQTKDIKEEQQSKPSERYLKFKEKLRSDAPVIKVAKGMIHPAHEKEPLLPWPNNTNPHTGEIGGPRGLEPTRYGDWQTKGRVTDF